MRLAPDKSLPQPVKIAARLASISESGLRKMIAAGVVPILRTGVRAGGIRVIPVELFECLRQRSTKRASLKG